MTSGAPDAAIVVSAKRTRRPTARIRPTSRIVRIVGSQTMVSWLYATDLFRRETIDAVAQDFENVALATLGGTRG